MHYVNTCIMHYVVLAFMKHYVQSINTSLTTVESIDTRDLNAQVGTTVKAVSYHFTNVCMAISAQEMSADSPRNMTNNSAIPDHGHAELVVTVVGLILQ